MKKILKVLFVIMVGVFFIPMVNAEELPKSGVTYFMQYPDGSERTTTSYNEASNPQETLIYSGVTDENGNVPLCNWNSSGQLRIVQHVPNGYTTNEKEMIVNLSDMSKATFVDYRGLVNPKTGRSLLVLLGLLGVVSVTILVSRKNKKSLMVIPVVTAVAFATTVKAGTCPCIKIKDGLGKPLAGVKVDIYAKPTNVDAAPAIKFDANGGYFFDGSTEMVYRLPSTSCTIQEFINSLDEDEAEKLEINTYYAYRDKYYPSEPQIPNPLKNGDVIKLNWQYDSNADLIVVDGNGGTLDFYGKSMDKITIQANRSRIIDSITSKFKNGDFYNIGYDSTPSCNNYTDHGIYKIRNIEQESIGQYRVVGTVYVCWNNKPDGIYVNGILFQGNVDSCYEEGDFNQKSDNSFSLYSKDGYTLTIGDIGNEDINFSLYYGPGVTEEFAKFAPTVYRDSGTISQQTIGIGKLPSQQWENKTINSIEVVKDGRTVAKYLANDLEKDGNYYYIYNDDTIYDIIDYMQGMYDNDCMYGGGTQEENDAGQG